MQLTSSPPALPVHTVATVLEYLHPALSLPLPSHLLSTSLIHRHHFLNLTSDDPQAYLSWPSTTVVAEDGSGPSAIEILAALAPRGEDNVMPYPIRYTTDGETVYAHVLAEASSLNKTVRIVFQWDGVDAWKYHDASTAPLPQTNFESPAAAISASTAISVPVPQKSNTFEHRPHSEDEGDDDYWNSYGATDDTDREHAGRQFASQDSSSVGEDAYWAQYGSVHGTADSTIPSPVPEKGKRSMPPWGSTSGEASPGHNDASARSSEPPSRSGLSSRSDHLEPLPIPPQNAFRIPRHQEEGAPPSPNTLRTLLEAIPRRNSTEDVVAALDAPLDSVNIILAAGSNGPRVLDLKHPTPPILTTRPREDSLHTIRPTSPPPTVQELIPPSRSSTEDAGLKQAIAGLHSLWLAGRQARGKGANASAETEAFLQVVREAIESR